jgi:hypothetical protein
MAPAVVFSYEEIGMHSRLAISILALVSACGDDRLAPASDGDGDTGAGDTGDGDTGNVDPGDGVGVDAILGAGWTMCARSEVGTKCWGSNYLGLYPNSEVGDEIGDDEALPNVGVVEAGGALLQLEVGTGAACMRLDSARLRCWTIWNPEVPEAQLIAFGDSPVLEIEGLSALSMSWYNGCLLVDGAVYCWGDGTLALGVGASTFEDTVARAESGQGGVEVDEDFVEVRIGGVHACARTVSGAVYCWGDSIDTGYDESVVGPYVGDDETLQDIGPLEFGAPAEQLRVHIFRTCGVFATGAVRCWGDDVTAEMAEETKVESPFIGVGLGSEQTCAVTKDGEVYCWGTNTDGTLGTGTPMAVPASEPAHIPLDEPIAEIVTLPTATCVRSQGGKVKCWGSSLVADEILGDDEPASEIPWLNLGF